MAYRSPTIHSLKLNMAGSPSLHFPRSKIHTITGVKNGYDNACHNGRRLWFTGRRTTHQIVHQTTIDSVMKDAAWATVTIEIRRAVVKAILVSAILFAMTAAFFS